MFKNKNQENIQVNISPRHEDFQYVLRCPYFSTQIDSAVSSTWLQSQFRENEKVLVGVNNKKSKLRKKSQAQLLKALQTTVWHVVAVNIWKKHILFKK